MHREGYRSYNASKSIFFIICAVFSLKRVWWIEITIWGRWGWIIHTFWISILLLKGTNEDEIRSSKFGALVIGCWCLHSNPNLLISPDFAGTPRVSKTDMNSRGWIMMFARGLEVCAVYWGISSQNRFLALVELLNSVTIFPIRSLFLPWLKSRSASWFHRFNWTFSSQNQIPILSPKYRLSHHLFSPINPNIHK